MAGRSYDQYCGVARALDLVGERWTLLIVRELLPGPRRYTDLQDGLPGVGTGLLAARLKDLEAEGIVARRRLPPPAGRELEPIVVALMRWGSRRLGAPGAGETLRPRWVMLAMRDRFDREAARGVRESYELRLDGEQFHLTVDDGRVEAADGPAPAPALVVEGDAKAFLAAARDPEAAVRAVADGALRVEGEPEALARCRAIFAPAIPGAEAEAGPEAEAA